MKISARYIAAAVLTLCSLSEGRGQNPVASKNSTDFRTVEAHQAWLTSRNAAGLRFFDMENFSQAEAYFQKDNGGFRNYFQSDDSYSFGVATESYFTLGRATLYGHISYNNTMGRNMTGSMWIDPYDAPFNIVEFYDSDAGNKNREDYRIAAGAGFDLTKRLRIGARFNYTATNYTKRKDLRHATKQLDMEVMPGLSYTFGQHFTVGANYIYARKIEEVLFKAYGTKDKQYYVLITPGAFYGSWELHGNSGGYTDESNTQPLFNTYQGAALQLAWNSQRADIHLESAWKSRKGYYGQKHSSYSPYYTEHEASILENRLCAAYKADNARFSLTVEADYESLDNYEMVYQRDRDEAGVYHVNYLGRNLSTERENLDVSASLRSEWSFNGSLSRWSAGIDAQMTQHNLTASVYPFYRKQNISTVSVGASLQRNFFTGRNIIGAELNAGFGSGSGFAAKDGLYTTPSASTAEPRETSWYLDREFEYLTTPRIAAAIGAGYTRQLKKGINICIKARYDLTYALQTTVLDNNRFGVLRITAGCTF